MRLLLDTCVALWWLGEPETIAPAAFKAIQSPTSEVFISAASLWQMAIKQQLGKLVMPGPPLEALTACGFLLLDITADDGWRAGCLPPLHRDPFDRMLVAQAERNELVVVTRDHHIPRYGVPVFPA